MVELNVEEWLNKLESTITMAKQPVLGPRGVKLVDEGVCLECINQIRSLLPSELSEARLIRKDAQNIVNQAQIQAQKILADANLEAQKLVAENAVLENARKQADDIVKQGTDYANGIVGQAYSDVARLYDDAEAHAREVMDIIMHSKAQIFPQYEDNNQDQNQDM